LRVRNYELLKVSKYSSFTLGLKNYIIKEIDFGSFTISRGLLGHVDKNKNALQVLEYQ